VSPSDPHGRLRGVTFAKQFPNAEEPIRGLFVAEQVSATAPRVDWRVIAPIPWVPRFLAGVLRKPYVRGDEVVDGVRVYRPRYPVLPRRLLYGTVAPAVAASARACFRRIVAEHRPQFVHAHALYPSAAAARRLAAEHGLPLVVSIHGSDLYTNASHPNARGELLRVVESASTIVCVSRALARDAQALLGAAPELLTVIPDTYDEGRFTFVERAPNAGPCRLVATGALVPVKGHAVLIDAVARLADLGHDVTLKIVGAGPLEGALRQQALDAGVGDKVTLTGRLAPEALVEALAAADLFVMPSLREGFGVALVEALATGLPAVATRSGGPEDVVGEPEGVLVEPGDADALARGIAEAIDRLDSFDREGISASVRGRFGRERVARALVEVYEKAVATREEGGRS